MSFSNSDSNESSDYCYDSYSTDEDYTFVRCKFKSFCDDGHCCVTWESAMQDRSIRSIQEPICEMVIPKEDLDAAYSKFLITLDGRDMTSYVDFFWRRSPVDSGSLEFVDRDARMDIYEYLKDDDLVPDMAKVHSGDWKFNKGSKGHHKKNKQKD